MVDRHAQIKEILKYLDDSGWSELIDPRWERNLKSEIKKAFPNIDNSTLNYVLNLVLWRE